MADLESWSRENLINLARQANADRNRLLAASIELANREANTLRVLKDVLGEFERICDEVCKVPVRNAAYRAGMELFN